MGDTDTFQGTSQTLTIDQVIQKALQAKDCGNEFYKKNQLDEALESYNIALSEINKISEEEKKNINSSQVDDLKMSLLLNQSMIYLKQKDCSKTIKVTTEILITDKRNIKALYRRAIARLEYGMYLESQTDLLVLLEIDPNNAAAIQQLKILKQKNKEADQKSKKSFSKIFSQSLYSDKQKDVEEKKSKEMKERRSIYQKELDEFNTKKEKKEKDQKDSLHSAEEVDNSNNDNSFPQFEEWEKTYLKNKEEEKANQNEQLKKDNENQNKSIISNKVSEDLDFDDEDLKIIQETKKMGYCYFKKELTENEKEINSQFIPKLIESNPELPRVNSTDRTGLSSWNSAGTTFESRDTTNSSKDEITEFIKNYIYKESFTVRVKEVSSITGEASIAVVRGKQRHLFDFNIKMECEYDMAGEVIDFTLEIPSLTSMSAEEDMYGLKDSSINITDDINKESKKSILCAIYNEYVCKGLVGKVHEFISEFKIK